MPVLRKVSVSLQLDLGVLGATTVIFIHDDVAQSLCYFGKDIKNH